MEAGKVVALCKDSGGRRVIGLLDVESTDELDQIIMAARPMSEYLTFEQVLPVRQYASLAEDPKRRWE
jgi:muconolactone delta-isomerase